MFKKRLELGPEAGDVGELVPGAERDVAGMMNGAVCVERGECEDQLSDIALAALFLDAHGWVGAMGTLMLSLLCEKRRCVWRL